MDGGGTESGFSLLKGKNLFTLAEGATHVDMFGNYRKTAFTLAEVLITLGIIGVVAALTLPTVIHNHKKKDIETKLARIYSVMNQAIIMAEAEHGDKKYWDYYNEHESNLTYENALNWYNKYLAKYIKTTKVEKTFLDNEKLYLYFADGSILSITPWVSDMFFYINGKALTKPQNGLNAFSFQFYPVLKSYENYPEKWTYLVGKGFEPYAWSWDGTKEGLYYDGLYACAKTKSPHYCTKIIQLNGWKIPDDYPLKF